MFLPLHYDFLLPCCSVSLVAFLYKSMSFALVKVLMRVEQEQKVTEDARHFAEQDVVAQRHAVHVLQVFYSLRCLDCIFS